MNITLRCAEFPGITVENRHPVFVGIQRGREIVDAVPGDTEAAIFTIPITVRPDRDGAPDFFGPCVHGKRGDRFLYLVWFVNDATGERFRRAKIKLTHFTWDHLTKDIEADVTMTDATGHPVSASLSDKMLTWRLSD